MPSTGARASGFARHGKLPYQSNKRFRRFGAVLEPRALSARPHSTSELLRTL